jgi:excisionase family DNA binding protein
LLTSTEAATLAAVAPSTMKRWADQGLLPVVRTAGGHRRFERRAVEKLMRQASCMDAADDPVAIAWHLALMGGNRIDLEGRLLMARSRLGSWCQVADELGGALCELGRKWEQGRITISDEHRASEVLSRALARLGDIVPVAPDSPRCLLACAGDDEHTLGLAMAELCLRELGHVPFWLGRRTPIDEVIRCVETRQTEMVALSASVASDDAVSLARIAAAIGDACREHGTALVLGGSGAWPPQPDYGIRVNSFSALRDVLASRPVTAAKVRGP